MKVGINFPWINYGWDFGPPPPEWVPSIDEWRAAKRQKIVDTLGELASLGFTSVRWFILGDGTNYGLGEEAPCLRAGKWRFDPLPSTHPFHAGLIDDFRFLLSACRETGLQLLPSLIDYQWAWPGVNPAGSRTIVKGGRGELLTDAARRESFFDNVLDPLLQLSLEDREVIVAWELINEPEWVVSSPWYKFWQQNPQQRTIPKSRMKDFLQAGVARINRFEGGVFKSTIGFAYPSSLMEWRSIGVTLDQFHYYPSPEERLPALHRGAIIGELATAANFRPWAELSRQTVDERLRLIESRGYSAAWLWSAGENGEATSWTAVEKEQVRQYLRDRVGTET